MGHAHIKGLVLRVQPSLAHAYIKGLLIVLGVSHCWSTCPFQRMVPLVQAQLDDAQA